MKFTGRFGVLVALLTTTLACGTGRHAGFNRGFDPANSAQKRQKSKNTSSSEGGSTANSETPIDEKANNEEAYNHHDSPPNDEPARATPIATIQSVTSAGTGCAVESIGAAISDDGTTLQLMGIDMLARAGSGISIAEGRRACSVSLKLVHDSGVTFFVVGASIPYSSRLAVDATAKLTAKAWHEGSSTDTAGELSQTGSIWQTGDAAIVLNSELAPCDYSRNLNLTVAAIAQSPGPYGRVHVVDPVSFSLQWESCAP